MYPRLPGGSYIKSEKRNVIDLIFKLFLIAVAFMVGACQDKQDPPSNLEPDLVVITAEDGTRAEVRVEIAYTQAQRQQGLMFRQEMEEDRGMLFLFNGDSHTGFWMRNTYLPLSIAYIGADGTVQEIRDGRPLDETILRPELPYRYVLEVNQGWFERHGLGVRSKVTLPPELPAPE